MTPIEQAARDLADHADTAAGRLTPVTCPVCKKLTKALLAAVRAEYPAEAGA